MIRVVTDSTSDLPPQVARDLGIGVVPVITEIDGVTYRDGVDLQREQFFTELPAYRDCKTATPPSADFIAAYAQQIAQGATEILSIHLGRRYSALCDSAMVAAQEMTARGVPVRVVDSGTLTICLGWMAQSAAEMARQGMDTPGILKAIDAMRPRGVIYAMADTLKYLRRSGRVSAITAGIGDLLQIKLLVDVSNGEINQLHSTADRRRSPVGPPAPGCRATGSPAQRRGRDGRRAARPGQHGRPAAGRKTGGDVDHPCHRRALRPNGRRRGAPDARIIF